MHEPHKAPKAQGVADPFVLLDDARDDGAGEARLYRAPAEIVVARRAADVPGALARIDALLDQGFELAGYLSYEAGLALEPRLAALADARQGAAGPLVWFGAFAGHESIPAADVPGWLARNTSGSASIGPLEPQLSTGGYLAAFAALREAIAAGDVYQGNLTFPLASDADQKVATAYGTWVEKSMYGKKYMGMERTSFLIGADGKIKAIWRKVKPEAHAAQVMEAAAAL